MNNKTSLSEMLKTILAYLDEHILDVRGYSLMIPIGLNNRMYESEMTKFIVYRGNNTLRYVEFSKNPVIFEWTDVKPVDIEMNERAVVELLYTLVTQFEYTKVVNYRGSTRHTKLIDGLDFEAYRSTCGNYDMWGVIINKHKEYEGDVICADSFK